ncbi:hypothetical protein PF005_g5667 [Phytophthora fragariae]|uniref:EF-hand domain-containing protein n=1 Tax=Phytophthora fragariae TaxID=53985 RepID=A0A6A3YXR4_9STRA|nr:hypothetical protein PF009_g5538 [Phytophthora fragariae]KAE9127118.1 hypothetical protein PF007_g5727 [Phytophthora fragariae]KAE9225107.1 hypothetical protein PF005_g5667 [Phytophthora fragariae]KAE9318852.1 hypothetical protein PF001_g6168 [Phytophthora fragariae]
MEEAVAANEAAILERRQEIRTSLRAVENSLREAGAVTDGYNSAYILEPPTAHWDQIPSSSLFRRLAVHVSDAELARSAALRFDFDAPDAVRYKWRVSPLGEAKCRRIWSLFDADEDEVWTYREFLEYMAALKCSTDSIELKVFEVSAEVWRMYMSDMCELDEDGSLTFDGFVMYRELIEDERPLAQDLVALGISLEWEELERVERIKQLFDEYVDDPSGNVTAKAAQYLLADIGFVLTSEETTEVIERRYQIERCLRFVRQMKRTLRLFGYRQKSALRFTNEGLARDDRGADEESKICRVGLLSLISSSWYPAAKTRWRRYFLQCRLKSFCALRRIKRGVHWIFTCIRQAATTGLLSTNCLQSRTPGGDRGDYLLKLDVGPKFSTTATAHVTYNSDADSAAALHELKYLERGAECFLYVDFTCRNGTKESDGQMMVERLTWFIGEFFRDHIETLPYFHRWFVTLPTKIQLRLGPTSSGAAGTSAMVVRLVILFTGKMDLYQVMQTLGLPSSMQFDHLIQRFSLRWLCSHSLEDLLVMKNLNLGAQWSCRTQMDMRLNRQAWAQIFDQVAHQLDAELAHEREDAEYIAQVKAEREQKKKKSIVPNQQRQSKLDNQHDAEPPNARSKTESRQLLWIRSLRRLASALKHSQQLSSTWAFANLGTAFRENQWLCGALSPQWYELLKRVLETPGGLAAGWRAAGESLRAEFADTNYAEAGATRPALGHRTASRATGSSTEFTLAPISAAAMKAPPTARLAEPPKVTARQSHIQYEPSQPATEAPEEKTTEYSLLEFYDLCARHLQGVHVVRAEAGTSGITCVFEGWNIFCLLPRIRQAPTRTGSPIQGRDSHCIAVCDTTRVIAIASGRFVDLYGASNNSLHPFAFQHQISPADHITQSQTLPFGQQLGGNKLDRSMVVVTCVSFPVPGFLLVGAFVEVAEVEDCHAVKSPGATFLLGFRLYPGSVSMFVGVGDDSSPRQVPAALQVHFGFVEPVMGNLGRAIRCLQACRGEMTPDAGAVDVFFEESNVVGVFNWRERFSERQVCLAQLKQQQEALVVAERSCGGRYLLVGDAGGRLSLLDFGNFPWDGYELSAKGQQLRGRRLELGVCSRSGVKTRDNPLEHVRLVHTTATSGSSCAYTSLRWWVCGAGKDQKQFVLAGKQDGSLSVLKLVQERSEAGSSVELKMIQMYPGLASGTHDAVRSISVPVKSSATGTDNTWFEFCAVSEMRWRTWRIKVAGADKDSPRRHRLVWPSLKDSLDFPVFALRVQAIRGIAVLHSHTESSTLVAKALSDTLQGHITRPPVLLIVADDRLQVIGLLTKTPVAEVFDSERSSSERNGCDGSSGEREREETQEDEEEDKAFSTENAEEKQRGSGPTTIQDKYKLPPMEWKMRSAALRSPSQNGTQPGQGDGTPVATRMSKLSRVDYNERVVSVMQRIETLSGVMKSMRTSFQLFSSDVQQHMNLISEQLERISRRRVTEETAQASPSHS